MKLTPNIPDGWTIDSKTYHRCVVIETNTIPTQYVSIDMELRFFEPGCSRPNFHGRYAVHPEHMTGRGWKDRLFQAAIEHLQNQL